MDDQVSRNSKCLLDTPTTDWREGAQLYLHLTRSGRVTSSLTTLSRV